MLQRFVPIVLLMIACTCLRAQTAPIQSDELWMPVEETAARAAAAPTGQARQRLVAPSAGRSFALKAGKLRGLLARALPEGYGPFDQTGTEITLPLPDGTLQRFLVLESPILHPKLAARFPEIRTYALQGIDDPAATGRADLSPAGFRVTVLTPAGQFQVDPVWRGETTLHVSVARKAYFDPEQAAFECVVLREPGLAKARAAKPAVAARATGAQLRTFRLAVSATGEFTAAVSGTTPGTVAQGLAAIVTTVNRVSAVYERDLAIRLQLVADEDRLIFTDAATDGLTNNDGDTLLDENQALVDRLIGNSNYDIGHVFSTGGGGLATLGCVCRPSHKARGVTGRSNPRGDPYDIDYVAHEMGHQFGANHTFNGTSGGCSGANREDGNAYEPGSGTTLMAYAGVCSPQNLAPGSDDYFHSASYAEIVDNLTTGDGTCAAATATGNALPVVAALSARTIPANTPFALSATATDADGDSLSYCWEEYDTGPAQDPTAAPRDNGSSVLFRSYDPVASSVRLFPSLTYILHDANVPPTTAGGYAVGETLPDTNRTMTFHLTVRDNRSGGGGTTDASTTVTSVKTSGGSTFGPFRISNLNTAGTLPAGTPFSVTWAVANSNLAPVSCANVRLSFSTDGGHTFPYELAASVPNTGSASVTIPNLGQYATTQGRIKVEAVGNIFFDLNDANLTITTTNTAPSFSVAAAVTVARGTIVPTVVVVGAAASPSGRTPLSASVREVPGDVTIVPTINAGGQVSVGVTVGCSVVTTLTSRTYPFTVVVSDSLGSTTAQTVNLIVTPNPAPTLGAYPARTVHRGETVVVAPASPLADANGNLPAAPLTLSPTTLPGGGTLAIDQATGAVTVATLASTTTGPVPVRVSAVDRCGAAVVQAFTLNFVLAGADPVAGDAGSPVDESALPANGCAEPGETVTFELPIRNAGASAITGLVATLQAGGGVEAPGGPQVYGSVGVGAAVSRPFSFRAAGNCGGWVTATLALHDSLQAYPSITYAIRLGVPGTMPLATEAFDATTPPALPAGWVAERIPAGAGGWTTSAVPLTTAPNGVFVLPSSSAARDQRLTSAAWVIPAGAEQVRLTFVHRWLLEQGYDGGILELSIDGGAFREITTAGGSFVAGGYTETLDGSYGNPVGSVPAWSGSHGTSDTITIAELPAEVAGHTVRLRWRLGNDSSDSPAGAFWRLDSVALRAVVHACGSAPAIISAAPPVAVVGLPYFHQFQGTGSPAPAFALGAGAWPAGLALTADGTLSGTPLAAGTGRFEGLSVTARNGIYPVATQEFALRVVTRLAPYLAGFGLAGAAAEPLADPDGDGLPNVLEYALGTDPSVQGGSEARVLLRDYADGRHLALEFARSALATDLTYLAEVTHDLSGGVWQEVARSEAGGPMAGSGLVAETGSAPDFLVEVRDPVRVGEAVPPRRFLRLRVIVP